MRGDARDRINTNLDVRNRIENCHAQRHQAELQRRQEYDDQHGDPAIEPTGPRPFKARLQAVQWPIGFKIFGVNPYDDKANPELWM